MTLVASETRRPGEPLVPGSRPIRSVPARSSGASAEGREFGRWFLGSALYSLTLGYGSSRSFTTTPGGVVSLTFTDSGLRRLCLGRG